MGKKILHIEDDPANRALVRKVLGAAGFEVVEAADGLAGARAAIGDPPDLILVDINIPELDGYEVTLKLRAEPRLRNVPIVAITAQGERGMSLAVGCDGFIQKPIDVQNFPAQLDRFIEGHRETPPEGSEAKFLLQQSRKIVAHLEQKITELMNANAQLREMDRHKQEFFRNISHELATPLTPIVGYLKLLMDGDLGPVSEAQARALNALGQSAERLRGLIDDLLEVTALETGRTRFTERPYDFVALARASARAARPLFEAKRIDFQEKLPGRPLEGVGDPDRLRRAMWHVLLNAAKFTPERGRVRLSVRPIEGRQAEFEVVDTGIGVPPEFLLRIFEPFSQVDGSTTREFGGAGVGLAIARRIVAAHRGRIWAESPPAEPLASRAGDSRPGTRLSFVVWLGEPGASGSRSAAAPR